MKLRRSGNVGDRADRSSLVQRLQVASIVPPGCVSLARGSSLAAGALGRGGSLGAGGEWVTICRPPAPRRASCSGARWGCGKGDGPEGRTLRRRRIPSPSPPGGQVELAQAGWSLVCVSLRQAARMRLTICTLLCAGALGEWRTRGWGPALQDCDPVPAEG